VYDNGTKRITAGAGTIPVPPSQDTRITSDSSHPQSGTALSKRKWEIHRELIAEKVLAEAIKAGKHRVGVDAAEVVAGAHAKLFVDSTKGDHKLSERLKVLSYTQRVLYPGLVLDERQRDSGVIPGGIRIEMSAGAADQLLATLTGVTGDTVEGVVVEQAESTESEEA